MKAAIVFTSVLIWMMAGAMAPLHAQEQPEADETVEQEAEEQEPRERRQLERLGVIFNTPNILLELDEYQRAGVGLKGFWGDLAVRGLLGLNLDTGRDRFGYTVGSALEYHVLPGRVSPYLGGGLILGWERDDMGPTTLTTFDIGIGPLFGVEFTLTEGLSVFAEYILELRAAYVDGGPMADRDGWNYFLGTELGNQGSLGIVVYFLDHRNRRDHEPDGDQDDNGAQAPDV